MLNTPPGSSEFDKHYNFDVDVTSDDTDQNNYNEEFAYNRGDFSDLDDDDEEVIRITYVKMGEV